jgi:hypothetical protein
MLARPVAARRAAGCSKGQQHTVFAPEVQSQNVGNFFQNQIKCPKSSSARRFSLCKPAIASLCSHDIMSKLLGGASGPSFWYVEDDGDRVEVLDDNDFQAAISRLKSSCVSLYEDFVSDKIEFWSNKNDDVASSALASSEFSHDNDGFISVEQHGDLRTFTKLPSRSRKWWHLLERGLRTTHSVPLSHPQMQRLSSG